MDGYQVLISLVGNVLPPWRCVRACLYMDGYHGTFRLGRKSITPMKMVECISIRAASWQNQQSECAPSEDSDRPGHLPSLIRVFAVRIKKAWVLSYPLSAQRSLIRLGGCPGWSESSLDAHVSMLVLSWGCLFSLGTVLIQPDHCIDQKWFTYRNTINSCNSSAQG